MPTPPRLSELMGGDHNDLDERWTRLQTTPASDRAARRELFESFRTDLLRHIEIEEKELFPRIVETDPAQRGLVERLQEEHLRIQETLRRLAEAVDTGRGVPEDLAAQLIEVLWDHNAREEAWAYPWLDEHLTHEQVLVIRDELAHHG